MRSLLYFFLVGVTHSGAEKIKKVVWEKKMKRFLFLLLYCSTIHSSVIDTYRTMVQQKIDKNERVPLSAFTDYFDALSNRWQEAQGYKAQLKKIVDFCRTIELVHSQISSDPVPNYTNNVAIDADAIAGGADVKLRILMVEDVQGVPYYAIALRLPDNVLLGDLSSGFLSSFDGTLKNRWIVFSLFDYRDKKLNVLIKTGLNFVADLKDDAVPGLLKFKQFLSKVAGHDVGPIRLAGAVGLNAIPVLTYFASGSMPLQRDAIKAVASAVQLHADLPVNAVLYQAQAPVTENTIEKISLDSINVLAQLGVRPTLSESYISLGSNFGIGLGSTIKVRMSHSQDDLILRGRTDLRPAGILLTGVMEGDWQSPFGMQWLTIGDFGIEMPLSYVGVLTGGVGLRGKIGLGQASVALAGKMALGLMSNALVMSGKVQQVSLKELLQLFQRNPSVEIPPIKLRDGEMQIAFGDTVIADREYKQGLVLRADIGLEAVNKRGGFEFSAIKSGSKYALMGRAYLPKLHSGSIELGGIARSGSLEMSDDGPLMTLEYWYDPVAQKFPIARLTLNGRVRVGSIFEGLADVDVSSLQLVTSLLNGQGDSILVRVLEGQRVKLEGKLFNSVGTKLRILAADKKDVSVALEFEQQLISSWEEASRRFLFDAGERAKAAIAQLNQQIQNLEATLRADAQRAGGNVESFTQELADLIRKRDDAIEACRQAPWYGKYACATVGWYHVLILSYQNALNESIMHQTAQSSYADVVQKIATLDLLKKSAQNAVDTIRKILEGGAATFGIERIAAQASVSKLSAGDTQVPATVTMRVLGKERTLYNVMINLNDPIASAGNFLRAIKDLIDEDPLSKQVISVLDNLQGAPRDYYAILGLRPGASRDEIAAAYKQLLRRYHPDTVNLEQEKMSKAQALMKFQDIVEAYKDLTTPVPREKRIWEID
jgi:hypothetical protein